MANTKISALTTKAVPIAADLIPIVDTVGGTTQKVTAGSLPVSTPVETRLGGASAPSAVELAHVKGVTADLQGAVDGRVAKTSLVAKGDLLTASAAATPAVITDVAVGQVLVSGGVGELPAWNANPSVNSINLGDNVAVGAPSSHTGEILLKNASNTNILTLKPGTTAADIALTLMTAMPAGNDYLVKVSTSGVMAYTDPSTLGGGGAGTPAGTPVNATATEAGYLSGVTSAIQTQLTAKRAIVPRVSTLPSNDATLTSGNAEYNVDIADEFLVLALAQATDFGVPGGTPVQGQKIIFRIKDSGTARVLTWNAVWVPIGVILPATTVISKLLYVSAIYNATVPQWDVLAVSQE